MAKAPNSIDTRLAVTVTARYYPTEGIVDAYCLDGRFPGRREQRTVDSTLDRISSGFHFSLFGYPYKRDEEDSSWRDSLTRLSDMIKQPTGDIDKGLNDMADAAMEVTGRTTISSAGSKEPYFSGIILGDGEIAAVTLGDAVALLYRYGILYPLTDERLDINAIDSDGHEVSGINDFIAGEAGTLRYSNIAQIEPGDIFLICNKDLYDALGQRDIMRILNSAEDQYDAAGLLMTSATAQMPGTTMQLMLGQVEDVSGLEKESDLNLGRFSTQAMTTSHFDEPKEAEANSEFIDTAKTQRYEPQETVDFLSEPDDISHEKETEVFDSEPDIKDSNWREELYSDQVTPPDDSDSADKSDSRDDDDDDMPGFAYTSPQAQRSRFSGSDYYNRTYSYDDHYLGTDQDDHEYDDYDEEYYDDYYDEKSERERYNRSSRNKQIVFYVILIAIIALSIFALVKLLTNGEDTPGPVESSKVSGTIKETEPQVIIPPTEPTATESSPTETDATEPEGSEGENTENIVHVVAANESPYSITLQYYDTWTQELSDGLLKYNGKSATDAIYVGEELEIPPYEELVKFIENETPDNNPDNNENQGDNDQGDNEGDTE